MSDPNGQTWDPGMTSRHIQAAAAGRPESVAWLITRYSPLLEVQAGYRVRGALRRVCDPTDVVHDVWMAVLPNLEKLRARDGRWRPVILRYLSTTLVRRINNLARKHLKDKPRQIASQMTSDGQVNDILDSLRDEVSDVLTHSARQETARAIREAILGLDDSAREILVLRGIEQQSNRTIALTLGQSESSISHRYRRALERLRNALPHSLADELPQD